MSPPRTRRGPGVGPGPQSEVSACDGDETHSTANSPSPEDMRDYWARRCQALNPSPVIAYLQSREDRGGTGRVIDPRRAA